MKYSIFFAMTLIAASASAMEAPRSERPGSSDDAASRDAVAKFRVDHCNLGEHYQFEAAGCVFALHNDAAVPLKIDSIKPSSAGDTVSTDSITIPPHSSARVQFRTNTANRLGSFIRFVSLELEGDTRRLIASGFVLSDLDDAAKALDFGTVNAATGSEYEVVALSSHAVPDFRIGSVLSKPDWLDANIGSDGISIRARVKPGAPWSPQQDVIKVAINTPHQKEAWIEVRANLQGEIIPSSNPYELGAMHEGTEVSFKVRLTSRSGQAFEIGELSTRGTPASLKLGPCIPADVSCQEITSVLPDDLPLGVFGGDILVELPDFNRVLPIRFGGLLVAKSTQIRKIDEKSQQTATANTRPADTQGEPPAQQLNLGESLKNSVERANAASKEPPGRGPLLQWEVANEQQVYGYVIYRASQESGPFVRINTDVIPVQSRGVGWKYQWRDEHAEAGRTYWYYIGFINKRGQVQQLSGAQAITAK